MISILVEFIDQLIDYPINCASLSAKYIYSDFCSQLFSISDIKMLSAANFTQITYVAAGAFWKGLKAQSALLQGARVVPPLKKTDTLGTEYVKAGGYRQAIKDFESVNPANRNDFRYPGKVTRTSFCFNP